MKGRNTCFTFLLESIRRVAMEGFWGSRPHPFNAQIVIRLFAKLGDWHHTRDIASSRIHITVSLASNLIVACKTVVYTCHT